MAKILMVVSAADSLTMKDGSRHPTGYWAEELAVSHRLLREAGHSVDLATPGGARPTVDAVSLDPEGVGQDKAAELAGYLERIEDELASPLALADVSARDYDAVVLPGGHGPMADLYKDPELGLILLEADADGKIIAPFCHGPAGLLSAVDDGGSFAFAGRRLAVFTDEEELGGGTGRNTPWLVESTLREKGAVIDSGPAWTSHSVVDGNLVSGQNPQSSEDVARKVLEALPAASPAQDS